MENPFNYKKICSELLSDLPSRTKEVISRRFLLSVELPEEKEFRKETLESIGKSFGICRERVRQIEESGFLRLKPKIKNYQKIFQYFDDFFRKYGKLRRESNLLTELGNGKWRPQVYFLLHLGEQFERFGESDEFYSLWTIDRNSLSSAKKNIDFLYNKLEKIGQPRTLGELESISRIQRNILSSYLEVSKKILRNEEGLFGLKDWPEINPKGVKDKVYLVLKKKKQPLHFREISEFIDGALPQTVHNELIKDQRFVLVGRGIYALGEWGYEKGQVKDIILKILKEAKKPLLKEEILEKVLKQRLVKKNTVLLNLRDKKLFLKNSQGKYLLRSI